MNWDQQQPGWELKQPPTVSKRVSQEGFSSLTGRATLRTGVSRKPFGTTHLELFWVQLHLGRFPLRHRTTWRTEHVVEVVLRRTQRAQKNQKEVVWHSRKKLG